MAPYTQRSAAPAPQDPISNGTPTQPTADAESGDVTVNKKKQKRRQKQAARLAAEQPSNAGPQSSLNGHSHSPGVVYEQNATQPRIPSNEADYGFSDVDDPYDPQPGSGPYYSDEDNH